MKPTGLGFAMNNVHTSVSLFLEYHPDLNNNSMMKKKHKVIGCSLSAA